ncbi:hypothetical protein K443DRAFT_676909 [Laccaria amethystina LaAM-08-1]|uniref:Uncharacterized protein n=1 Tax=Laccaria amethystina LaAM-08-1 TaxID=1095629 RepID=A0A0C9WV36_9AGAR|nr:hypothetical protein K443DRAFT_676909 [Laccaria amethystina LaAM-08-1]
MSTSLTGRPRARWKPPAEPERRVSYFESLICDLNGEIEQFIKRDDDSENILLLTIKLSRWILAEAKSLPPTTALRMNTLLMISLEAYTSLLQSVLTHLAQKGRSMDHKVEKGLNDQLGDFLELFRDSFSMARSAGSYLLPPGENPSFFCNASNFTINGGTFIGHIPDTNHHRMREEIFQSISDDNSAVIRGDIVKLQQTSEMILRAMCFNIAIIVLFS